MTGRTGRYLSASGAGWQLNRGENTTVTADGSGLNASNWAFEFDLIVPDL